MRYAFIKDHERAHAVRRLCKVLDVHPSGYYAWRSAPDSARAIDDRRLLGRIKQSWLESGSVYGYRKVADDLRELGERCGKHRVARLMRAEGLHAQRGYRRRPGRYGGKPAHVAPNVLQREFAVEAPNRAWVTDITYIRTHEGWLYLAVVLDLGTRCVVGWAMRHTLERRLACDALEMALERRRPEVGVLHHSDRGCQYASSDFRALLEREGMIASMSRKGDCWDNAVVESFFSTLKSELVEGAEWATREEARLALFEWIEVWYNRQRRHSSLGYMSPMQFEQAMQMQAAA